jgi:flagellar hook assembly protein FlgD
MHDILVWLGNQPPEPVAASRTGQYKLSQNYPNPFNPQTTIDFQVKELAPVTLKIYNVRGQLVKTLADDRFAPGVTHTVTWDGRNNAGQQVSSGVYFYKLVTNNFTQTKKMVLLK